MIISDSPNRKPGRRPVIALLTDYAHQDFFVASLHAVILSIQPEARIVDVSHDVPSFDVRRGSYLLGACYKYFPEGTIFVAVVDPGVGTKRRLILAETERYCFIAPDNGVLSGVLSEERPKAVIEIKNSRFFLPCEGRTFDGRDKLAPVAAWLSSGRKPEEFGPKIRSWKRFPGLGPKMRKGRIAGHIVYIDKFGNCFTDIPSTRAEEMRKKSGARGLSLTAGGRTAVWSRTYGSGRRGGLLFLPGSQGTIEIAVKEGSAAERIGCAAGDPVEIRPLFR